MKKRILSGILVGMIFILGACGKTETTPQIKEVSLEEIHTGVKEAYGESYAPAMALDEAALLNTLGVDSALCEEYIAEIPMISMQVDTFAAVKAKEGKAEEVKKALETYRESLVKDTMQYPMNQIKIQASKVVSYGNYVFFIMLGFIPAEVEEGGEEAAILKGYEAENQKAVDVIEAQLLIE